MLPDFQGSNLRCPDCKVVSPADKWVEAEAYCELCGDHYAVQCPNPDCTNIIDLVEHDLNEMEAASHDETRLDPDPPITGG